MSKIVAIASPRCKSSSAKVPWASVYTPEIASRVCDLVAAGRTLAQIGRDEPWAPSARTLMAWQAEHPDFRAAIEEARKIRADHLAQEIVELADSASTDLELARLPHQISTRQWLATRMNPREYGDRKMIEQNINANVRTASVTKIDVSHLTMEELRVAEKALLKAVGQIEASGNDEEED